MEEKETEYLIGTNLLRIKVKTDLARYVRLVHKYGLWSKYSEFFKRLRKNDEQFTRRVKLLDECFLNREQILK